MMGAVALTAWIACVAAPALATGADDLLGAPQRVSLTATAEGTPVGWGIRIEVTPHAGVHVYSPGNEGYIGVSVSLDLPTGLRSLSPQFPEGEPYVFGSLKELVTVYEQSFEIRQPVVRTGKGPRQLPVTVSGTVRYQACTDKICFPPQEQTFDVSLPDPSKSPAAPRGHDASPGR
jgi:DsbC/DsbD-like thiol-disulfide interchange protein